MSQVSPTRLFAACGFAILTATTARADPIAPAYYSFLGAPVNVYLNFTGDNTPNWGVAGGALSTTQYHPGITPAYDLDNDATTFNTTELDVIHKVWQRVAEKYSPFNINVTTVD